MKKVIYFDNKHSAKDLKLAGFDEVVLSVRGLSRYGSIALENIDPIREDLQKEGLKVFLELDRILVGAELDLFVNKLEELQIEKFDALRILDAGLIDYVLEDGPKIDIHFISEMGNHNLDALLYWEDYIGERLTRILLCPELSSDKIKSYSEKLKTPTEVYSFGKILLFYTPRHLLSPYFEKHDDPVTKSMLQRENLEVLGHSEESPHKGFPLIESSCGSFMFSPKDLCVLDYWEELVNTGTFATRLDLRDFPIELSLFAAYFATPNKESLQLIKENWGRNLIRGFFKANKSDVLFGNLKNTHNLTREENYLGDVIETKSGSHMVLEIKSLVKELKPGTELEISAPDKKAKIVSVKSMKNLNGDSISSATNGDFVLLPHFSSVSSGARVYFKL